MKLLYIGAGFVGACSAAAAADSGHDVLVYDIDKQRIEMLGSGDRDKIESCLFEQGLGDLLVRNHERILFSDDYRSVKKFAENVEAIFMCLPTPEKNDGTGEANLDFYNTALAKLSVALCGRNDGRQSQYIVMVNKSTVPIEMVDVTAEFLHNAGVKNFGVVSNPEFLVEGKAIEGSLRPNRVVVGAWQERDFDVMRQVYQRFYNSPTVKYIETNPKEAAAGKLLANYLLFSRLVNTYNVVGRASEAFDGIRFEKLRDILTTDERIGQWGFFDSLYAGGSCLIKDSLSLKKQLGVSGFNTDLITATVEGNELQKNNFFMRARAANFDWQGKKAAVLGAAFKRDTNDIRNSPAVDIIKRLIGEGVSAIKVYDPGALPVLKQALFHDQEKYGIEIEYCESEEEALSGTDACLILTDWPQFRALGAVIKRVCPSPYLIMDGRRMLAHQFDELGNLGYDIVAVGSSFIKGKK